ncbi:acetyltransferase (GNAT family) [Campylobacter blaseri]|uniref:GNAT family N-acetyltransferase n=1 Tax=Campylobacter blaseri TaxID=2042961 RepID=A0A2P8R413_9BACT|nr:GNAT family N-acetyltransferase [Campylobacter blaseri]PSM53241.1 GNAT family N-acetyltransferase [Campylobacter blaseri]PSM54707.1 GNAT family N-acetyltransferase [Campylobacter blaseri]QKF86809.1 acetyltransferase (GNAT family) [Campylobacter blaseri]
MIKIIYEPDKKRVVAYDGDKNIGESTYSKSDNIWIIDHTFVKDSYTGQGIAGKLVALIVQEARKNGVKIIPLCPFAKSEFDKNPNYSDLL